MRAEFDEAFDKVSETLNAFYLGKLKDRNTLLKEWLAFLDFLKGVLAGASEEDKRYFLAHMQQLSSKLAEGIHVMMQTTGMTEDRLETLIKNPANFDAAQWKELKSLKEGLEERMRVILPMLRKEGKRGAAGALAQVPKKKKRLTEHERRLKRRSKWVSG